MAVSILRGRILYAQIYQQSGAGSLDVVDSFACDPNKTYSQLAYHLPAELVNERDHRCVKDEL